ncbi:hypothetical protein Baya_11779 [Bagarius yarrelli]|uniref:Uncharacterized protein n=1 Tax=Bagarius yarrelli TaxID=175774 RepID=A0A556V135_BAGYA|nr:hypothetical protein Baya_11779 [Bagarius yarrelli]
MRTLNSGKFNLKLKIRKFNNQQLISSSAHQQSVNQSSSASRHITINHPANQPTSQSVNQSIIVSKFIIRPRPTTNQPTSQSNQSSHQSSSDPTKPTNQPTNQSVSQSINHPTDQPTNHQSIINHPDRPANQSVSQSSSIIRPTNQPTNHQSSFEALGLCTLRTSVASGNQKRVWKFLPPSDSAAGCVELTVWQRGCWGMENANKDQEITDLSER